MKGHAVLTTDVLAELVASKSRGRSVGTRDFLFGRNRHKESDDIASEQATDDCGWKAEREREKA